MTGNMEARARRAGAAALVGLAGLLARGAALLPFALLAQKGGAAAWLGGLLSLAVYIALVVPLRCWSGETLRRAYRGDEPMEKGGSPYKAWLLTGLIRHGRGWLWGLPFLACVGYFVIGYSALSVTDMWRPVQNLPTLLGLAPSLQTGLIMAGIVLLLLAALFAWGWRRDLAVEYLPSRSLGPVGTVQAARQMRKRHGLELAKTTLVNFLLWLPGAAGLGAAAVSSLRGRLDFSGAMALTGSLKELAQGGVPRDTAAALLIVFFLVYLPLCLYRKSRNAAAVAELMEDENGHAAG